MNAGTIHYANATSVYSTDKMTKNDDQSHSHNGISCNSEAIEYEATTFLVC